ncbi:MAG: 2-oxoacid:acceptor oxidoreductase family protein [Deltaproteobacteria bacterium]|nr:2-oxoacid:acceptor oxidoreductase family protein [Deltaproteobacteria bacterium]MBW2207145.1 2-oxoacid:acceptor oxidoreductase family protein [Deltaproteobacteria bacterium]
MQDEVQFAGFGGQGIMLMGQILAQAGMEAGHEVVWIPSYGPEMRGGTAYCTVVISDRLIGSPIIRNPKHLVAMNRPSLEKFAPAVKPGGVIFINSSMINIDAGRDDVDAIKVPIIKIATDLGNIKTANIIALAAFVARSGIVDFDLLKKAVQDKFAGKQKLIPINMKALEEGRKAALGS